MKARPLVLVYLMLLAGCAPGQKKTSQAPASASVSPVATYGAFPTDTTWALVDLGGQPAHPDDGGMVPDLRLDSSEKRASGNAGCNRFFGNYAQSNGDSLQLGPLASTRRACVDPALHAQESAYLKALNEVRTWSMTGGRDTLVLSGASGPLARFVIAVSY